MVGWLVLGLDYFGGDSYAYHIDKEGFDVRAWVAPKRVRAAELLPPWIEAVRAQYGKPIMPCSPDSQLFTKYADVVLRVGQEIRLRWFVPLAVYESDS